jgi:hypothetical protein
MIKFSFDFGSLLIKEEAVEAEMTEERAGYFML